MRAAHFLERFATNLGEMPIEVQVYIWPQILELHKEFQARVTISEDGSINVRAQ